MCESLPGRDRLGFSSEGTLLVLDVHASKPISRFQSDWHLPVLWRGHGLSCWCDTDLARALSRWSMGIERTGLPPARTLRERRGRGLLGAWRSSGYRGSRPVPSPVLGMGSGSCPCGDPDRGKRGERHPGRFLGGGNRVDSCGRDTLFSFASASANCFPQEGFSTARNSLSLYLYLIHLSRESSGISPRVWGYFAR